MDAPSPSGDHPFEWFGSIQAINLDEDTERWNDSVDRYEAIGIETMVRRFSAVPTPQSHHIGCALSWRGLVEIASNQGQPHFLGLEDDAVFHTRILDLLPTATAALEQLPWDLFYLGCVAQRPDHSQTVLQTLGAATTTHALAINHTAYDRILADVPGDRDEIGGFIERYVAIDQYFSRMIGSGEFRAYAAIPHLASQPALLNYPDADLAIAGSFEA